MLVKVVERDIDDLANRNLIAGTPQTSVAGIEDPYDIAGSDEGGRVVTAIVFPEIYEVRVQLVCTVERRLS
jgi:hypothetical protein